MNALVRKCLRKKWYPSKDAAQAQLDQRTARGIPRDGLEAYPCGDHGHIGHRRQKMARGRR